MWNRLFKSKSLKESSTKKKKKRNQLFDQSLASSSKNDIVQVISDGDDIVDSGPETIDLRPCPICSRTFAPVALEKHVGICENMTIQKRTPFDSFRQRRKGTELATYLPSDYGSTANCKNNKQLEGKKMSSSLASFSNMSAASLKINNRPQRTISKFDCNNAETPLNTRSMKKSLSPINEVCPHCGRSFGLRAYDRHVGWCKERSKITHPTLSAQQHLAKERMQARTKYKAPTLRSKREKNREKYSSLSESMNNLSDCGGISIMDFNSVADPFERGRKSSIMSISMTSSIASDGGLSDKYDPFISAKRQFDDLFSSGGGTIQPAVKNDQSTANMSTSMSAKLTPSPTKSSNLTKSSFRRASSLRVPKKTSPTTYMPRFKPSIQRGISDEGPISTNFMKPEEFDELPVKSHAIIPPDLVPKPKSPKIPSTEYSAALHNRRQNHNCSNSRKMSAEIPSCPSDFQLTKTDSLATFLNFENELNHSTPSEETQIGKKSEEKSNDTKANDLDEYRHGDNLRRLHSNSIKLAPIERPLIKHKILLEPSTANFGITNKSNRTDDSVNSVNSMLTNSCDNLKAIQLPELFNRSVTFDQPNKSFARTTTPNLSTEPNLTANRNNLMSSTRHSSSAESIDSHQNMELIVNFKNITGSDKRNPKRQLKLRKDNLLFDSSNENNDEENNNDSIRNNTNDKKNIDIEFIPSSPSIGSKIGNRYTSIKNRSENNNESIPNLDPMFDDFDLEEFISSFSDCEQFPIFKNYKKILSARSKPLRQESTSEESEFGDEIEANANNVNARTDARIDESTEKLKHSPLDGVFKRPDVTVEAEQRMKLESELIKSKRNHFKSSSKFQTMLDCDKSNDGMTQAERELLVSVHELNEMCGESGKILDLTSETPRNEITSTIIHSSTLPITEGDHSLPNWNRFNLSFQIPELIGVHSDGKFKELSCMRTAPASHSIKRDESKKLNTVNDSNEKHSLTMSGFDRILPPIFLHKNDSQNIHNTINMTNFDNPLEQDHSNYNLTSPISLKRRDSKTNSSQLPKFCHECGAKFIVDHAKFCMECGIKRTTVD